MAVSVNDLKIIASKGGGMILDAKKISANDLEIIASRSCDVQAQIVIKNPDALTTNNIKIIASRGKGRVVFDFYGI